MNSENIKKELSEYGLVRVIQLEGTKRFILQADAKSALNSVKEEINRTQHTEEDSLDSLYQDYFQLKELV